MQEEARIHMHACGRCVHVSGLHQHSFACGIDLLADEEGLIDESDEIAKEKRAAPLDIVGRE